MKIQICQYLADRPAIDFSTAGMPTGGAGKWGLV